MLEFSDRSAQPNPKIKASTRVMQSFRMRKLRGTYAELPNPKVEYSVAEAVLNKDSSDIWVHVPPCGSNMNYLMEITVTSLGKCSKTAFLLGYTRSCSALMYNPLPHKLCELKIHKY